MRKKTPEKKVQEPQPSFFVPVKETKKEREARLNAIVKKAIEGIKQRDGITPETPNNANHSVAIS